MDSNKNASSFNRFERSSQFYLDRITPFITLRWLCNLFLLISFILRVVLLEGYYLIAYGLGIFFLNQLILFLSPKQDPSLADNDEDTLHLPTISRLPEFKFWCAIFKALMFSLMLTLFSIFDVPVYWHVLVIYFFVFFLLLLRQRISHMIRCRYVPFTYGKMRYTGQQKVRISTN